MSYRWCVWVVLGFAMAVWAVAQAEEEASSEIADYRLQPSDVIIVDVVGEKDLERREFRVSSEGGLTFPYLDVTLKASGLTTSELAEKLKEALVKGEIFVDPQIIVQVREYRKRSVTVIGQVTKQGVVDFPSEQPMNLLEAIGYAGGFTQLANKGDITITRKGQQLKFDLKKWLKDSGNKKEEQSKVFVLEPGDLVFVPESIL